MGTTIGKPELTEHISVSMGLTLVPRTSVLCAITGGYSLHTHVVSQSSCGKRCARAKEMTMNKTMGNKHRDRMASTDRYLANAYCAWHSFSWHLCEEYIVRTKEQKL